MPAGDGTGPGGSGSMTGRGAGYCAGFDLPGSANPLPERGRGKGFGRGRGGGHGHGHGWRHRFHATGMPGWLRRGWAPAATPATQAAALTVAQEVQKLKEHARWLEDSLAAIHKRLCELDASATETQG